MLINRFELIACLLERGSLRFSPAGLPLLDAVFEHQSLQQEAGFDRQVAMQVKSLASGSVAERLVQVPLGAKLVGVGFMAQSGRSTSLRWHLIEFSVLPDVPEA